MIGKPGLAAWLALLLMPGVAGAGEALETWLETAWQQARDYLTAPPAETPPARAWVGALVQARVDGRYLARQLLAETDPEAGEGEVAALSQAVADWLSRRGAEALRRHRSAWRRQLHQGEGRLIVQRAGVGGVLASARVTLEVAGQRWEALVQLHRRGADWRVYDVELAGLGLQGWVRSRWLALRDRRELAAAIQALADAE